MGGAGAHGSGDLFLAFATGNRVPSTEEDGDPVTLAARTLSDAHISPLFWAAIEATEEAIVNALLSARTMVGRDGHTAHALPHDRLADVMARYRA